MNFILSKIFWALAQPLNALLLLACVGLATACGRSRLFGRVGKGLLLASGLGFFLAGFTALPDHLLRPLEDALPAQPPLPQKPAGIIILGGAFDTRVASGRKGAYGLNGAGDRLLAGMELVRRFPDVPLIYTGGVGALLAKGIRPEAEHAREIMTRVFGSRLRLVVEGRSRNTWENALFTKALVKPKPGDVWLVVTSAFHALRARGCFRRVGLNVVMWPTDYRADPSGRLFTWRSIRQFDKAQIALKEYAGIIAYTLMGRMDWPW